MDRLSRRIATEPDCFSIRGSPAQNLATLVDRQGHGESLRYGEIDERTINFISKPTSDFFLAFDVSLSADAMKKS